MTKMSETVRQCYIGFLRYDMNLEVLRYCSCLVCEFRNLYQVKFPNGYKIK